MSERFQPEAWVLGHPPIISPWLERSPLPLRLLGSLRPETTGFQRLLNCANHMAFEGLGMPAWVQLDCCTLPGAFFGFGIPKHRLPAELWSRMMEQCQRLFGSETGLEDYTGLVPISGFCALPSGRADTVVGVSMFSLVHGQGLGLRAKALSLLCQGARTQLGVTQYDNPALRTHTRLGSLEILAPQVASHSRADSSFSYQLDVPPPETLRRICLGQVPPRPPASARTVHVELDAGRAALAIQEYLSIHGAHRIAAPGLLGGNGEAHLVLEPYQTP